MKKMIVDLNLVVKILISDVVMMVLLKEDMLKINVVKLLHLVAAQIK